MRTRSRSRDRMIDEARNRHPGAGEQAGEAAGGIGGALAGAGLGALVGPITSIVAGLAGAAGGWWAGEKIGRAAEDMDHHEEYYRHHWERHPAADIDYEDARVAYSVGHIAGRNPDYMGSSWEEVDTDMRRGWTWEERDYETMRPYVRAGYERGRASKR